MKIENLTSKQQANLRQKHSNGLNKDKWAKDQQIIDLAKKLNITVDELRKRVAVRMMGVYGI